MNEKATATNNSQVEWGMEQQDEHALRLEIGCMTFEVDLDAGTMTMETDIPAEKARAFCEAIVNAYNAPILWKKKARGES